MVLERRRGRRWPILERRRSHAPNDPSATQEHSPAGRQFRRHLQQELNRRVPRKRSLRFEEHAGVADVLRFPVSPDRFADRPIAQRDADFKARRARNVRSLGGHDGFSRACKSDTP
jgi:hypothetical protein